MHNICSCIYRYADLQFLEQEGARLLIEFWMAADNFCSHLQEQEGNYDSIQAQTDAMVLYDKYVVQLPMICSEA